MQHTYYHLCQCIIALLMYCCQAARRRGKNEADVRRNLEELESILPGLVNLDRMPAKDWVSRQAEPQQRCLDCLSASSQCTLWQTSKHAHVHAHG